MAANKHWRRWIHASVAKHLSDVATTASVPSHVEGVTDRDSDFQNTRDRIEIRMNGPFTHDLGGGCFNVRVFINVLVSSAMGEANDAYTYDELLGKFHNAVTGPIEIFKYGDGPDDDDSSLGCMHPLGETRSPVRVLDFGEIDPTDRLRQGMLSATYEIELNS